MKHQRFSPTVVLLSGVVDVMRREVLDCPVETGGVLLGRRSTDGEVLLVSAAGAPGPNALHEPTRFRADARAQQALLHTQHHQFGVGYVGEWHKHPGNSCEPSSHDHAQLDALLSEPTRQLDSILACIVTCTEDAGLRIRTFFARLDDDGLDVRACPWHDVPFMVEPDRVFEGWPPRASEGRS